MDTYQVETGQQPPVDYPSALYSCAKSGCGNAPTLLSNALGEPTFNNDGALAVANGTLYAGSGGGVATCSTSGCATAGSLFSGYGVSNVTIANGTLYAAYEDGSATHAGILSCNLNGCGGSPTLLTSALGPPEELALAVDATNVYWTTQTTTFVGESSNYNVTSELDTCPLSGCATPQTLVSYAAYDAPGWAPIGVTVDATYAYFTVYNDVTGSVERIVK